MSFIRDYRRFGGTVLVAVVVAMFFAAVAPGVYGWAKRKLLRDDCLKAGHKWAVNGDFCISRDCANNGTCRASYTNNVICRGLKIGISREELFFQLGMPEGMDGEFYVFPGGGGGSTIKALIENERVRELKCS